MNIFLEALDKFIFILIALIFIRVVLSWLPLNNNRLNDFINVTTEPILTPIRTLVNHSIFGGKGQLLDLSPFVAVIILQVVQNYIQRLT